MKSIVIKMLLFIVLLYVGATYMLYSTQDKKIFLKSRVKDCNLTAAKSVTFKTSDNIVLDGAFIEHAKNLPLVLYFGGNASNAKCFIERVASKIDSYNFIAFNYPGYGKSQGNPSQKKILQYALELYNKYHPDIVAGRSLGSAVATYLASKEKVEKLLLITPIDSIRNIAKNKFGYLPVDFIIKHPFDADRWMPNVEADVAVLLVSNENIVPKESVKNIISKIKHLKFKKVIEGVNYSNLFEYPQTLQALKEALGALQ